MDIDAIKDVMKFLNWEMVGAISLLTVAFVQYIKASLPETILIKGYSFPFLKVFILVFGIIIAYFTFRVAGKKVPFEVAAYHGFFSALISALGYELIKGTTLQLRSKAQLNGGAK